jgi:hypothetical protein
MFQDVQPQARSPASEKIGPESGSVKRQRQQHAFVQLCVYIPMPRNVIDFSRFHWPFTFICHGLGWDRIGPEGRKLRTEKGSMMGPFKGVQ